MHCYTLVTLERTRAVVTMDEIRALAEESKDVERLLQRLADQRLHVEH